MNSISDETLSIIVRQAYEEKATLDVPEDDVIAYVKSQLGFVELSDSEKNRLTDTIANLENFDPKILPTYDYDSVEAKSEEEAIEEYMEKPNIESKQQRICSRYWKTDDQDEEPVETIKKKKVVIRHKKHRKTPVHKFMDLDEDDELDVYRVDEDDYIAKAKRGKKRGSRHDDDEEFLSSKKIKKKYMTHPRDPELKAMLSGESEGMKSLRSLSSAMKSGPRYVRGLNGIVDNEEREKMLINRLHADNLFWEGEYPSHEEIEQFKKTAKVKKVQQKILKEQRKVLKMEMMEVSRRERGSRNAAKKAQDTISANVEEEEV